MNTGICRAVLAWNSPRLGAHATSLGHSSARAVLSSSSAGTVNVWVSTSTVILGLALRLRYQSGWAGDPPLEPTIAKRPSPWREQASGVTRSIPDLAPMWWMRISVVSAQGPPTRPWFARNSSMILVLKSLGSACSRVRHDLVQHLAVSEICGRRQP